MEYAMRCTEFNSLHAVTQDTVYRFAYSFGSVHNAVQCSKGPQALRVTSLCLPQTFQLVRGPALLAEEVDHNAPCPAPPRAGLQCNETREHACCHQLHRSDAAIVRPARRETQAPPRGRFEAREGAWECGGARQGHSLGVPCGVLSWVHHSPQSTSIQWLASRPSTTGTPAPSSLPSCPNFCFACTCHEHNTRAPHTQPGPSADLVGDGQGIQQARCLKARCPG